MKLGLKLMPAFSIVILLTERRQDKARHLANERISIPVDFHSLQINKMG